MKTKKIDKSMREDFTEMAEIKAEQEKIRYACLPDAQAAVERLPKGRFHRFVARSVRTSDMPRKVLAT